MLGRSEDSGLERCTTGDQVYVTYHGEEQLVHSLQDCSFKLVQQKRIPSPSVAPKATTDWIVIARSS